MGGVLLYNVEFTTKKDRDKFEKQEKLKRMFQYWSLVEDIKQGEEEYYNCYYYPSWEGYYNPQEILQRCKKNKIKIKKFLCIDLSTNGNWFDEIKQEDYKDDD